MGGLLTDAEAKVLDIDGRPIPGLYAAGGTASGIQGGMSGGTACSYVGGLALALVFGVLAAEFRRKVSVPLDFAANAIAIQHCVSDSPRREAVSDHVKTFDPAVQLFVERGIG